MRPSNDRQATSGRVGTAKIATTVAPFRLLSLGGTHAEGPPELLGFFFIDMHRLDGVIRRHHHY